MTGALLVGLGFGVGLVLLAAGVAPAPQPLAEALADLHRRRPPDRDDPPASNLTRLFGRRLAASAPGRRLTTSLEDDLRVCGMSPADHLAQRALFGLTGLLWAPLVSSVMWAGGLRVGFVLPLWLSVLAGPAAFLLPSLTIRSRAAERRRGFRHALSAFLDIVSISLAGGRGVDTALHEAANAGNGWAFEEMRRALLEAQLRGETPWWGLNRLGSDLGLPELNELAASAALAGAEGARVRASLAAKARALRLRGLTDIEAAAQGASERMSLPVVLLMFGFIVFLGYPALAAVLAGV